MRGNTTSDTEPRRDAATYLDAHADPRSSRAPKVEASEQMPEVRRNGRPTLAIRARYGDRELNVEARDRWAIAALVVLAAIVALTLILAAG